MTWEKFDNDMSIPKNIRDTINFSFDRNKQFNIHTIASDGYYQWFILDQKIWIKNLYKKYLKCKNMSQVREILFYLIIIVHGIETQHYFHIKSKGKEYAHILNDFRDMFDDIEEYVENIDHNFISSDAFVTRWDLTSKIELVDINDTPWSIRCSSDITLKHILYSIISTLMYKIDLVSDDFHSSNGISDCVIINTNFINFMKGIEISYQFNLSTNVIEKIINILYKNSTTDKIPLENTNVLE